MLFKAISKIPHTFFGSTAAEQTVWAELLDAGEEVCKALVVLLPLLERMRFLSRSCNPTVSAMKKKLKKERKEREKKT